MTQLTWSLRDNVGRLFLSGVRLADLFLAEALDARFPCAPREEPVPSPPLRKRINRTDSESPCTFLEASFFFVFLFESPAHHFVNVVAIPTWSELGVGWPFVFVACEKAMSGRP